MQGRSFGAWSDIANNTLVRVCVDEKVHLVLFKPKGGQEYRLQKSSLETCNGRCRNIFELPADAEEAVKQFLATPAVASHAGS